MFRTTKLVALFALSLSAYAAGCSNDDEALPPGEGGNIASTGGSGGSAGGAAGTKATGGSSGHGGTTGGSSGAGAKAGAAGVSGGGAGGGTAGKGGTSAGGAGAGGSVGGSAGAGGSIGGTAGAAGEGGGAGASGSAGEGGSAGGQGGATGGSGGSAGEGGAAGTGGNAGSGGNPLMGTPDDKAAILAMFTVPCTDDITKIYDDATPPSPWDASHRGDVIRCAYDRLVPASEMQAHYDGSTPALPNPGIYTDVHKIRLTYWTERDVMVPPIGSAGAGGATSSPTPVLTSAVFYVPALRVAKPSPLLVYAHPTVGSADICAPSKDDPMGANDDWRSKVYGLIGHGWTLVMPDMPGLGTSGTPAWQDSEDEAHSLLDGMRAIRKITMPSLVDGKNAVLGHSEGGHGVLAAQSYAASYGTGISIDALVAFAPVSFSQGSWGAILTSLAAGMGLFVPGPLGFATQYLYGHLAKYEGESHRTDAFLPAVAAEADAIMQGKCEDTVGDELYKLAPNKKASDIYTATYVTEVGNCGAFGSCAGTTAQWWRARWAADRPTVDTTLPIVIWQGSMDAAVTPNLQQCGIDRLVAQGAMVTACGDPAADHSGIASSLPAGVWSEQYLRSKLFGEAAPAACAPITRADGTAPKCAPPPPNSTMPGDP